MVTYLCVWRNTK